MTTQNEIKLPEQILAELTPASPEWEKLAAYNHLLRLRDIRDMWERDNAIYSRDYPGDLAEIARREREQNKLLAKIECGAMPGAVAPAAAEEEDTRTADQRLAETWGVMARPCGGILPLASDRHAEERAAREYATRAAHHARLHLADAAEVTPASLDAYFAGIFRRLDTESAPSLAAQALAASWQ